jgi:hypothetical protein
MLQVPQQLIVESLADLASRINAAHKAREECFTRGVAHAVEAGRLLHEAKKRVECVEG